MDNTPPEIHIHSEVTDTGSKKESRVKITIRDNGIGFDDTYADQIFIIFQRLHGKTEYECNGIGLAICKRIVENHNGRIKTHSRPGEVATLANILPLQPKEKEKK